MGDSLRWVAKDRADIAGVLVAVDKGSAVDAVESRPADGEIRIGILNVDRQRIAVTGNWCGQLIGGVQQPRIAGFGGKQQQRTDGHDPTVALRRAALDVTDFIGQAVILPLDLSFS